MKEIKSEGRVYTPDYIIEKILDEAEYFGETIINKTVLEPSFGDGRFIKAIISRLIFECRKKNFTNQEIARQIENNIYGIEINSDTYKEAKDSIIKFIYEQIEIYADINLYREDTLTVYKSHIGHFDYIVGNPPYVRIHNINDKTALKEFYFASKSSGDLYLAFFEAGIKMLKPTTGRLVFITPSTWMYNKAGSVMREYITGWPILSKVIDFGHKQIFKGYTTYTSITVIDLNTRGKFLEYEYENEIITKKYEDIILGDRFCFTSLNKIKKYREIEDISTNCLCKVKNGYATLADTFFINNFDMPKNSHTIFVYKCSTGDKKECFYPYDKEGNIIPENEIEKDKDLYNYLINNKEALETRSLDNKRNWYGFGRSQAIKDTYTDKIAVNQIVKEVGDIKLTECPAGTGIYSGLYLITKYNKKEISDILNSEDFFCYIKDTGIKKSGGYYSFSSGQLEKYLNYSLLLKELTENKIIYTKYLDELEPIKILTKDKDIYGYNFYCETEDGCEVQFRLKDIGNNILFN